MFHLFHFVTLSTMERKRIKEVQNTKTTLIMIMFPVAYFLLIVHMLFIFWSFLMLLLPAYLLRKFVTPEINRTCVFTSLIIHLQHSLTHFFRQR